MFRALIKLFVERKQGDPIKERERYGLFASVVGLILNICLGILKLIIGSLAGSVAILADAVNNLTDVGSSTLSIISFKIAAKKPDEDHPFGHARIEYLLSTALALIILWAGGQFFIESIRKIFNPAALTASHATYIVLILSIAVKLWMYFFYSFMTKEIDTVILKANAQDSLSDVLGTSVILISVIASAVFKINIDGYIGLIVAFMIAKGGWDILKSGADLIVGKKIDSDENDQIKRWVFEHQGVLGVHDLIIHDYGPGHRFASVHIEVDSRISLPEAHDLIDYIENRAVKHLDLQLVAHVDPVDVANPELQSLQAMTSNIVMKINDALSIHDFRIVQHKQKKLLIFDCVIPSHVDFSDRQLKQAIQSELSLVDDTFEAKITFDRNYVRSKTV